MYASTLVEGNLIGTNAAGTAAVGNRVDGIEVVASGVTIGGTVDGAGNVISGNASDGVEITGSGEPATSWQGITSAPTSRAHSQFRTRMMASTSATVPLETRSGLQWPVGGT